MLKNNKHKYSRRVLLRSVENVSINPLNPKGFCIFERFSAFTRPIGLRDSIFKVTIESAAVLKH